MKDLETLKAAVRRVARANGARIALLFGSHARGTATERSDVDLIFVEETSQPFLDRLERYMGPLADELRTGVEAFVYTPEEFGRMKEGPFVQQALREGLVIHES